MATSAGGRDGPAEKAKGENMIDRRITFIDADENPLVVWLKQDRVQLFVVDSEPELEGAELRGFALALFVTYVGAALTTRLEAARKKIGGVRDKLAATGGADELLAALDGSLSAIEDVARVMTMVETAIAPGRAQEAPPDPPPPGPGVRSSYKTRLGKPTRPKRAGEGGGLRGWGWARHAAPSVIST